MEREDWCDKLYTESDRVIHYWLGKIASLAVATDPLPAQPATDPEAATL